MRDSKACRDYELSVDNVYEQFYKWSHYMAAHNSIEIQYSSRANTLQNGTNLSQCTFQYQAIPTSHPHARIAAPHVRVHVCQKAALAGFKLQAFKCTKCTSYKV